MLSSAKRISFTVKTTMKNMRMQSIGLCRVFQEPKVTRDVLSALDSFENLTALQVDSICNPHVAGQVVHCNGFNRNVIGSKKNR